MSAHRLLRSTARPLSAALLILLGCVSSAGPLASEAQDAAPPRAPRVWDGRPAPGPYPAPPGIEFPEGELPPAPAPLGRDSAVVGRLTQEGQSAKLTFEAEAGELSLFDLTAYGYARGWDSTSQLVVRDAAGEVLAQQPCKGPALFSDFLPFTAPSRGAYTLDVVAQEHYFRYLVVRHSSYHAAEPGETFTLADVGDVVAHGWTGRGPEKAGDPSPASSNMRFVVRGEPGAPLALRAEPTSERGWKHKRSLRAGAAAVTAGLVDARRLEQRMDPRLREDHSFPDFTVKVEVHEPAGAVLAEGGFNALVRFPPSGLVLVTVGQSSDGPGGLFDLFVERSVTLLPCTVRVGDAEDEPVADVDVVLLREPALERIARGKTASDGTVTLEAPPGGYTIVYRPPGRVPTATRTAFDGSEVVNVGVDR
jgi:hypothetical protein